MKRGERSVKVNGGKHSDDTEHDAQSRRAPESRAPAAKAVQRRFAPDNGKRSDRGGAARE